jgi:hypothetical protein
MGHCRRYALTMLDRSDSVFEVEVEKEVVISREYEGGRISVNAELNSEIKTEGSHWPTILVMDMKL